jgi:hypothetical protein
MKSRTTFIVGCSLIVAVEGCLAVSARTVEYRPSWEFTHCGALPRTLTSNERLICSDRDLRQLDQALGTAYRAKETILNPAQTEALRHDEIEWKVRTCREIAGRHAPTEIVRKCLSQALRLRRQFVEALPVDRADVPYRLSRFERLLLQNYSGSGPGVLNMMISGADDAVRAGLRRVFMAIMPGEAKQDIPMSVPQTASDFIENAFGDSATLEDDRYFIDRGAKIHDGSQQGMFVIDLETGDMTMASISAHPKPQLFIWELACTPQSLKDFARIRFRQEADHSANDFAFGKSREAVQEYINANPCR